MTARVAAAALTLTLLAGVLTGCGTVQGGTPNAPLSTSGVEGLGDGPTNAPTTPATTAPPAPPTYPATARAYAEAILTAWRLKQQSRLADLTTAQVEEQIIEIPGPPNQQWVYQTCDGAAGSSYCAFVNVEGDVITLRISNQFLGKPDAATEVKLDLTVYAPKATDYVKSFVEAWRNGNTRRMLALSSQGEVDYFTHYTPPSTYTVCSFKVGTLWQVRVYNSDGLSYLMKVTDAQLTKPHAITSHVTPVPLPPVCS